MCFVISYIHTVLGSYWIILDHTGSYWDPSWSDLCVSRLLQLQIAILEQKNQSQVLQQKDKKDSEKWNICGQTIYSVVFLIGMC